MGISRTARDSWRRRLGASCLCLAVAACHSRQHTQISNTPAGAYEVSLAAIDNGFVTAWYDTRDGHGEIYMRRLDASGQPIASERRLTTGDADAYEADIVSIKNAIVIGWYEKSKDGRLTPKVGAWALDGTAQWTKTLSSKGRNTVVRALGGLAFAAWIEDEDKERSGVWGTWLRADGVNVIPPRRLADAGRTTWNLNAAIDPNATPDHPHAWVSFDANVSTTSEELFLVDTTETGDRVVRLTPDDGAASKYPDIAFADDTAAVTWFDMKDGNEQVYVMIGATDALIKGAVPPIRVADTRGHSIGAYLAWNGDRLGLAWCDDTPGNQELYFRSFDRTGYAQGPAQRITTTDVASSIPAIKPWRTGFALLWNEYQATSADGHGGGHSQVAFRLVP